MQNMQILIDKFIESTLIHNANCRSDVGLANKHLRIATKCMCKIKQYNGWTKSVVKMLKNPNGCIRCSVAYHLLPYKTFSAFITLMKLELLGYPDVAPKILLEEWVSGKLKFPELENGKIVYKLSKELINKKT